MHERHCLQVSSEAHWDFWDSLNSAPVADALTHPMTAPWFASLYLVASNASIEFACMESLFHLLFNPTESDYLSNWVV